MANEQEGRRAGGGRGDDAPAQATGRQGVVDRVAQAATARHGDVAGPGAAIVATGQAEAGQDRTYRRIGDAITAMLRRALLVRATVPSTFPLLLVASGQIGVF